jgi:flagellar biosynthesis chaperone FliJ
MSLPFVIEALLVARRARRDGAFERVRQCRVEVRDAESARDRIALNLNRTATLRTECIARLSATAGEGASSAEYGRAEDHIAMLGARADEIRIELSHAERAVTMARSRLEHAIAEFMRTHKQLDAALEQKAQWENENGEARVQEDIVRGRSVNRFANRR